MSIYKDDCLSDLIESLKNIDINELFKDHPPTNTPLPPWNKGKVMDENYKQSHKGYVFTPEQYEKVINHLNNIRYKIYTTERNNKISQSLIGQNHTEERKNNISKSKKDIPLSEGHKKKISESMKGKKNFSGKHSEETKKKMSEAKRPPPWNKGLKGYKRNKSTT